jgi:hypothetical protein
MADTLNGTFIGLARLQAICLVTLAIVLVGPTDAAPLPGTGTGLASCILIEDASAHEAPAAASDDDDEDEDDDESETLGFLAADGITCIAAGGSVTASAQVKHQTAKYPAIMSSTGPYSSTAAMGLKLATSTITAYGALTTALKISTDTTGMSSLDQAVIAVGTISAGYDGSQFNNWTGENFAGSALQKMPSNLQLVRKFPLLSWLTLAVSIESPVSESTSSSGASSVNSEKAPPAGLVVALEETGDVVSGKVAFYGRPSWTDEVGVGRPAMWAMNAGLEYDATALWSGLTVATQATVARNAPESIGNRFERATIRNLNLPALETLGWSGVISLGKELTDEWSMNAYASFFKVTFPSQTAFSGRVSSIRGAANLTWSPTGDFSLIMEVNVSQLTLGLSGRSADRRASGNATTTTLTLLRDF